jgi:aryl-alcohol dehydrogenase-like predicted oxidoreductase
MMTEASSRQITIGGDLRVNRIGYGAMKLTGDQVWGPYPDQGHAIRVLRGVVEAGVSLIDTADVYGPHDNELLIKEALHPYPPGLVIATKGGFVRGGFDYGTLGAVGNPNYLRQSAHMSARRLGLAAIDLYYLHSGRAVDAPFEDQVGVLAELRQAGLIRHVGLSNVTLEQLRAAQVLTPIAAAHGAKIQQIALAWQLQGSPRALPIPGTTSLEHLRENLAAQAIVLSPQEMRAINDITAAPQAG